LSRLSTKIRIPTFQYAIHRIGIFQTVEIELDDTVLILDVEGVISSAPNIKLVHNGKQKIL